VLLITFYRKSLHNYAHPRTDAVVIMIAVDDTEDKVLLGRGVSLVSYQNTSHSSTIFLEKISWKDLLSSRRVHRTWRVL